MLIPQSIRDCVCFVYAKVNGEVKPAGTAFFFYIPIIRNAGAITVVTALHVIAKIEQHSDDCKALLRVNAKSGGFHFVEVDTRLWVKPTHTDGFVDVCFCPWPFPWEASDFDIRYFSADQAATADVMTAQGLQIGNEVAFAGLFVRHSGHKQNEPIVRFGNIAAMPVEPVSTRYDGIDIEIEAYLIESRSVGGFSGSPVFVDPGLDRIEGGVRKWRPTGDTGGYLLGVVHGHWQAPREAAEVKADEATDITTGDAETDHFGISKEHINMGIAIVTPIDKLLSLINESPWRRRLDAATKHVTGQEDHSMVVIIDAAGELIEKIDVTAQSPVVSETTVRNRSETE